MGGGFLSRLERKVHGRRSAMAKLFICAESSPEHTPSIKEASLAVTQREARTLAGRAGGAGGLKELSTQESWPDKKAGTVAVDKHQPGSQGV